jgi:hypothetical protein
MVSYCWSFNGVYEFLCIEWNGDPERTHQAEAQQSVDDGRLVPSLLLQLKESEQKQKNARDFTPRITGTDRSFGTNISLLHATYGT